MRTIKFRAWDGDRMQRVLTLGLNEGFVSTNKLHSDIEDFKLMQYTGLKDKNGREIYEGDILKHIMNVRVDTRRTKVGRRYESYAIREDKEVIGVVKQGHYSVGIGRKNIPCLVVESSMTTSYNSYFWGEGKRGDMPKQVNETLSEPLFNDKEYEVIGNIYETPELLGASK